MKVYQLLAFIGLLGSTSAYSFDWGATNLSYLKGDGYKNFDDSEYDAEIVTFEHVNGNKWGDTFFFIDVKKASTNEPGQYYELNPRVSSKKTLGIDYGSGILADVLLTTQYNGAAGLPPAYLYGLAVDLNLPSFKFFQTHFYIRDDKRLEGTTTQLTLVWNMEFDVGAKLEFGGFLDYAGEEGKETAAGGISAANLLTQPYLIVKLHDMVGLGIEYQYWSNAYGAEDLNESVPQYVLRFTL